MATVAKTVAQLNATTVLLNRFFQDSYQQSLIDSNNWVSPFLTEVSTTKQAVNFIFYGDLDDPTEVGKQQPPEYSQLLGYQLDLSYVRWQNAIRIAAEDFYDDDIGALNSQVMKLADKYANIYRIIAADILNNGATSAYETYDGVNLFDNAHIVGSGTFDNLLAGTGVLAVDLQTAYTSMMNFPTDKNTARDNNVPTNIIVPPGLMFEAKRTLNNAWNPADNKSTENDNKGLVQGPIVESRLTDANDWFLIRSNNLEKPFIGVRNANLDMNSVIPDNDINSEGFKNYEEYRWWIRARRSLHPTHPHLFAKIVNA